MNVAAEIISMFGGKAALARALGHKHCTTVQGWEKSGVIPRWRHAEVREAAERLNIPLSEELLAKSCRNNHEAA